MLWSVSVNMESSSVQSNAKCGNSDFSIERILSDDSRSSREESDVPNWLCCTRYRPPRLPRSLSSGCRARRSGRHARVPFTGAQAAALEAAYARAPYLAPPALRALAAALQLRDDRIKIWFQNRRARERREKCANITAPVAITLPATSSPRNLSLPNSHWPIHNTIRNPHGNYSTVVEQSENPVTNDESLQGMIIARTTSPQYGTPFSETEEKRPETPLDIEAID